VNDLLMGTIFIEIDRPRGFLGWLLRRPIISDRYYWGPASRKGIFWHKWCHKDPRWIKEDK